MNEHVPIDDQIPRDPARLEPQSEPQADPQTDLSAETKPSPAAGAFCGRCGADRSGLDEHTACLKCGARPTDPRCTFCGYILTGLQVNEKCPECGKPIWDSNINPPTSGQSVASLVLGIVSLVSCLMYGIPALILGPLAIIFGEIANRQFKRGERGGNTKGFALAGRICGWIGLAAGLTFAVIILWVILTS